MCACFCFHSCESPSCGRRDVASCCCGSTCNTRFVSSVSRVTVVFCPSFLLFTVFLLFSRYAAECCGPAAAGYYEPAGHHHGKPSTWICVFFFCSSCSLEGLIRHLFVSQAQQMTMQAMAMVGSPVTSPPTSPVTSPPMSPLLTHPPSPYAFSSPYVVIPPSPYANIPPSPYANFSPNHYVAENIPPSPYPPTAQPAAQPQASEPNPQPSSTKTNKTTSGQPKAKATAQVSNSETWGNGLKWHIK